VNINDYPPKAWSEYIATKLNTNTNPVTFTGGIQENPSGPSPAQEFVNHLANYEAVDVKYVVLPAGSSLPPGPSGETLPKVFADSVLEIRELPSPKPYFDAPSGACRLQVTNRERMSATCSESTVIVRRELYMPGWHATVNGRSVPVSKHQDGLFQTLTIPTGTSTADIPLHSAPTWTLRSLGLAHSAHWPWLPPRSPTGARIPSASADHRA